MGCEANGALPAGQGRVTGDDLLDTPQRRAWKMSFNQIQPKCCAADTIASENNVVKSLSHRLAKIKNSS
jgi:hypothetical protein